MYIRMSYMFFFLLYVYTEPEITSLDAGLRTDGLLALDLWDVVIDMLRSTNNAKTLTKPGFLDTDMRQETVRSTHPKPNRRETEIVSGCHR